MTDDQVDMDAWIRANARRRRPKLADIDRPATTTATTNNAAALTQRLLAEGAPTEQEGTDAR